MGRDLRRVPVRRSARHPHGATRPGLSQRPRRDLGLSRRALALIVLLSGTLTGCSQNGSGDGLLVLAAASLTEALRALEGPAHDAGLDPDFSFAGSQVVLEQVAQGAPADVVAVADPALLPAGAVVFAHNRIVVVAATASSIHSLADLTKPDVRVALAAEAVPVGGYARDGLEKLGLLDDVLPNVVSEELDVKGVVAKVGLGAADAGVVYATDARSDDRLRVVGDPLPVRASYAAAVAPDAPHPDAARGFLELLTSPAARRVLQRLGFTVP